MATRWVDPDFGADEPAFYYGRVLEIPTPSWTTYDHQLADHASPLDQGSGRMNS